MRDNKTKEWSLVDQKHLIFSFHFKEQVSRTKDRRNEKTAQVILVLFTEHLQVVVNTLMCDDCKLSFGNNETIFLNE